MTGAELFARYAVPPNLLGYCGPQDRALLRDLVGDPDPPVDELAHTAMLFEGAYPYLELIAGSSGRRPLDRHVVDAYWIGNSLLAGLDPLTWSNAIDDRFRRRAGERWDAIAKSLPAGGLPNHAFHVFCVYPWVGLLGSGLVEPALGTLDRCRIAWGTVVAVAEHDVRVRSKHLQWTDGQLSLGDAALDTMARGPDPVNPGDVVSLHWDTVCERLTPGRLAALRTVHDRHLQVANRVLGERVRLEP